MIVKPVKKEFFIAAHRNGQKCRVAVKGYCIHYKGFDFGIHKEKSRSRDREWTMSELSTGLSFHNDRTLTDAIAFGCMRIDNIGDRFPDVIANNLIGHDISSLPLYEETNV